MNPEEAKALFESLDEVTSKRIAALDLLADDTERQKALYWEARRQGMKLPVPFDPVLGAWFDALLGAGVLDWASLTTLFLGFGEDVDRLRQHAALLTRELLMQGRTARRPGARGAGNRQERRRRQALERRRR